MPRPKPKKQPVKIAFRPQQVSMELTTKHTHRIFTIKRPTVKFVDLKENPDRILLGTMERGYVRAFAYKSNPNAAFICVGEDIIALDCWNWAKLVKLLWHCAWYMGVFGKRAKKYRVKTKNVSNRYPIRKVK